MCLAIPMRLIERDELRGTVEIDDVRRDVRLELLPDASVGDYLLVHAGYAIGVVDEQEAIETVRLMREAMDLEEGVS